MNKKYWWNWSWRIKNIDVTEVEKHRFYQRKNPVLIYDVDIKKKSNNDKKRKKKKKIIL